MRRAIMGSAVIVAVTVSCLLGGASPAAAEPTKPILIHGCPDGFVRGPAMDDAAKDKNGDGYVCRKGVPAILPIKMVIVIDNNVPPKKKKVKKKKKAKAA